MSSYTTKQTPGDTSWFVHDRFGMFIHFGLYALPARHEWIKKIECIPEEKYQKYFEHFNPDMFDAKALAKKAKSAGMKYAVLTTKHHEGFCLFDTKYTDYNVMNTPFGRTEHCRSLNRLGTRSDLSGRRRIRTCRCSAANGGRSQPCARRCVIY